MHQDWTVRPRASAELLGSLGVESPLLAQLLLNRGIGTADAASAFLDGATDDCDPFVMAGMPAAVERVARATADGDRIVVHGDYDVDGLSGATLLAMALKAVGAQVDVFIPHRERDGYGIRAETLDRIAADGVSLLISVDCGISAADEISASARPGLDVIITDHHQVPPKLPSAVAILNPHRSDCPYPYKQLSGAGVALRFALALLDRLGSGREREGFPERLYELAALGTIADVMPLAGENRGIVRRGLRRLNTDPSPGVAALCRRARVDPADALASTVAYKLAPRLNAAGRIDDAIVAHRLLAARSDGEAEAYADQLEALNLARRALTDDALRRAHEQLAARPELGAGAVVVAGEYPLGVLGLIAARLAEEHGKPAVAIRTSEAPARGSVRGVPGFDAADALRSCSDLLLAHGGHAGAAGLSIDPEQTEPFRTRFQAVARDRLAETPAAPPPEADCRLLASRLRPELLDLLARLEPCGEGNRPALFETRSLRVRDARVVGGDHVRLSLGTGGPPVVGVMFNGSSRSPLPGDEIDLLYEVHRNVWQGSFAVELQIKAWRPADTARVAAPPRAPV